MRAAFRAGPCLLPTETYGPTDLPRASPSPRPPRGSKGATCTGTDDTGEPKVVWGVGAGAPRVEGGLRSGPWRRCESPRVAAAERRQVRTLGPAWGQKRWGAGEPGSPSPPPRGGGNGLGLTGLQLPLSPFRLGLGREHGVPRLLLGQLLGQEVNLIFQSGPGQALPWRGRGAIRWRGPQPCPGNSSCW